MERDGGWTCEGGRCTLGSSEKREGIKLTTPERKGPSTAYLIPMSMSIDRQRGLVTVTVRTFAECPGFEAMHWAFRVAAHGGA